MTNAVRSFCLITATIFASTATAEAQVSGTSPPEKLPIELIIHVPEDAKLELMGKEMPGSGPARRFTTPPVETGKTFQYSIRATWNVKGQPQSVERKVEVVAGKTFEVSFVDSGPTATELRVLELVNAERAKVGVQPLAFSDKLIGVARRHAANMASQQTLSHPLDGKEYWQRIEEAGYSARASAENIAQGARSPEMVVKIWMESPGHRDNMLSDEYREIGIGLSQASNGEPFWAQVFGTPVEK